jgi:hypothetical protein
MRKLSDDTVSGAGRGNKSRLRSRLLLGNGVSSNKWYKKHRSELPIHLQSRFSNATLRDVGTALQNMGIAVVLDEENLAGETGPKRRRSEIAQTYVWWRVKVPPYRGKWDDMHRLASIWRMSPAGSVRQFRTVVYRIFKGVTDTTALETSWESVLSEK